MSDKQKTIDLSRMEMFDGRSWNYGAQKAVKARAQKDGSKKNKKNKKND